MNPDKIRELLPEISWESFDNIRYSRVLGANRHIRMIGQMFIDVINNESDSVTSKEKIHQIADYFKETRGNQSRAVYHAINQMLTKFDSLELGNVDSDKELLIQSIEDYEVSAQNNTKKIVDYANNLSENFQAIMVYDYSSTLNEFIKNSDPGIDIYIAESRALDGGRPFIDTALESGHKTFFFPDSTMLEVLKKCDAAFIGAESYYPDGTCFNTIGSDILSLLCKELGKPLYVLTPLLKVDERNMYGHVKLSPMEYDYSQKIATDWDQDVVERVNFNGIKLVSVSPENITAYVCEKGVIPPYSLFSIAVDVIENL